MLNFCIYTIGNWILNFKRLAARTAVANLSAVCNRYLYWSNWKWISRREDLRRSLISPPKWLSNVHWISFTAQPFESFQRRASTDPAAFAPTANGFIWTQGDRLNSATLQICGQIESKMPNDRVEITRLCQDTEVQWLLPARYSLSSNFSTLRVGDALDLSPFECITRILSVWQLEAECPGSNLHVMLGVWFLHVWCSHATSQGISGSPCNQKKKHKKHKKPKMNILQFDGNPFELSCKCNEHDLTEKSFKMFSMSARTAPVSLPTDSLRRASHLELVEILCLGFSS